MKRTALVFALAILIVITGLSLDRTAPASAAPAASAQYAAQPLSAAPGAAGAADHTLSLGEAPLIAQAAVLAVFLLFCLIAVFPLFSERPQDQVR